MNYNSGIRGTRMVEPQAMSIVPADIASADPPRSPPVSGFSLVAPACPECELPGELMDAWDAFACLQCRRWLDGPCGMDGCDVCAHRPKRPQAPASLESRRGVQSSGRAAAGEWLCRQRGCPARFDVESRRDAHERWPHFACECGRLFTPSGVRRHRGQIENRGLKHEPLKGEAAS
jgi:hypothetical protein